MLNLVYLYALKPKKHVHADKDYFQQVKVNKGPLLPISKVVLRTATALDINKNTVAQIGAKKQKTLDEEVNIQLHTSNKKNVHANNW